MKKNICNWYKAGGLLLLALPLHTLAAGPPKKSELDNPVVQVFVLVIGILAVCIALLANVLLGAAQFKMNQHKEAKEKENSAVAKTITVLALVMIGNGAFAADTPMPANDDLIGGMNAGSFYLLLSVVLIELFILLGLLYNLRFLLKLEKETVAITYLAEIPKENKWIQFWDKINSFRPAKEEASIDLGHDYDGIRELDNRLPPWWLYGFFACILFAVVYLWRFEVVHSAPSSLEEYTLAMQKGEEEKEAYLQHAANKVDENSVKLLTGESDLASGKAIFTTVCAACHSVDGGGLVGPNLTDDYWLHGGSVKDIFKTIKYGWQEKGMKSWKDDYTPVQIAQLTSYIKSLRGKIPLKPKEPQGVLFQEKTTGDSAQKQTDTLRAIKESDKKVAGIS